MTLKDGIATLKERVNKQLEFIKWLKSKKMYTSMDSAYTMNRMHKVWETTDKKVYLVIGYSGEHDSYQHWIAKAFFDKDLADDYRINCVAESGRIKEAIKKLEVDSGLGDTTRFMDASLLKDPVKFWDDYTELAKSHEFDPKFEFDAVDMDYLIEEIEVE